MENKSSDIWDLLNQLRTRLENLQEALKMMSDYPPGEDPEDVAGDLQDRAHDLSHEASQLAELVGEIDERLEMVLLREAAASVIERKLEEVEREWKERKR